MLKNVHSATVNL